jgi:hypothetical protein
MSDARYLAFNTMASFISQLKRSGILFVYLLSEKAEGFDREEEYRYICISGNRHLDRSIVDLNDEEYLLSNIN